jgi:hypothetical protein
MNEPIVLTLADDEVAIIFDSSWIIGRQFNWLCQYFQRWNRVSNTEVRIRW